MAVETRGQFEKSLLEELQSIKKTLNENYTPVSAKFVKNLEKIMFTHVT